MAKNSCKRVQAISWDQGDFVYINMTAIILNKTTKVIEFTSKKHIPAFDVSEIIELVSATRKSQAIISSNPTSIALPVTAANIGFLNANGL